MSSPDDRGHEELLPQIYEELHGLAQKYFRSERPDHTLQPTALVHEAYLRLSQSREHWDRDHFYCVAAKAMRHILINHARDRRRLKRCGGRKRVALEEGVPVGAEPTTDLLALDEALAALTEADERKSRVVELRYFAGLSIEETARVLGVSSGTVKSDWALAKAWLHHRMTTGTTHGR